MVLWKRVVALTVLMWLPLQGVAAIAMPFCRQADAPLAVGDASGGDHDHHGHHGDHHSQHDGDDHTAPAPSDDGIPLTCNDCGPCHLACAPAAVSAGTGAVVAVFTTERPFGEPSKPRAFIPEQPKRPPLLRG
jgi:hypothetical protein